MRPLVPVLIMLTVCGAAAGHPAIEIKPCTAPLWLELSHAATATSFTLRACGAGGVDTEAGDEAFHTLFPNFELRQAETGWIVVWSADPGQLDNPRNHTLLQPDRRAVPLAGGDDASATAAYQLRMWPRLAPRDVQINAEAGADQILRELARVTGVRIDGVELQQPEPMTVRFVSMDRNQVIEYVTTSAWRLQLGPDHFQLGTARAEGTAQMSREDFLQLVSPQTASDFPQPAIDLHAELALKARSEGRDGAAIEHIRAALALLQPYPGGEADLALRLQVELCELLVATGQYAAAQAALPAVDVTVHDPELLLRLLALQLRWTTPADLHVALDQVAGRLDALPAALVRSQQLLLLSVRAAARIAAGELGAALPLQTEATQGWRRLPYDQAMAFEPGPQIRRQLLLNEVAMIATLSNAGHSELVDARIAVADWLEQLGGDEAANADLIRLKEKGDGGS